MLLSLSTTQYQAQVLAIQAGQKHPGILASSDAKLITLETAEKQLFFRGFLTKLGEH